MKTIEIAEATGSLRTYARLARKGPVVVTERGKPVAAVVPLEDSDIESLSLSSNPDFVALIERSRAECTPGSGISTTEIRRRLAKRRRTS